MSGGHVATQLACLVLHCTGGVRHTKSVNLASAIQLSPEILVWVCSLTSKHDGEERL